MSDHSTAIVSFTRDLRVHDNPALERACRLARRVVLLFVVHEGLGFATANRRRVLHESLADPRQSLRDVGGDLLVRHGDPVTELMRLAEQVHAGTIVLARDVSRYARRRADRIRAATGQQRIRVEFVDAVTVVLPAASTPSGGGGHFRVFTPYWRSWSAYDRRRIQSAPLHVEVPSGLRCGRLPAAGSPRAGLPAGGETAARRRMRKWLSGGLVDIARADYRPRVRDRRDDPEAMDAWRCGRTGVPLVDAGMRQLAAAGFLHNRVRLVVASFLTKQLGLHWSVGARRFFDQLVDGGQGGGHR